ncbi:MAG: hypothetical protein WAL41_20705 [Mycobacterium sp.]
MTPEEVRDLFDKAQEIEEWADSYFDEEHYAVADEAWNEAFEAAEQLNGAQELERLAQAYGWSTPVRREAEGYGY